MKKCYVFAEEPSAASYAALIDFCCARSSHLLLVVREQGAVATQTLDLMRDDLVAQESTSKWPGTVLFEHQALSSWYRVSSRLNGVLKHLAKSLFEWVETMPEDPCFFRSDGTALLTTISHERDAYLYLDDTEYAELEKAPELSSLLTEEGPVEPECWNLPLAPNVRASERSVQSAHRLCFATKRRAT